METLKFTGKIIAKTAVRTGKGEKGQWSVQDYVAENTDGRFPTRLVFTVFGEEKIKEYDINIGEQVTVSFDPAATERDGRWYPSNRAFRVEKN